MDFITEDMRLAVKRGAHWMDENYPGWAERIDTDKLDMGNCEICVLGQAVMDKGYWRVVDDASEAYGYDEEVNDFAMDHGFDAESRDITDDEWYDWDKGDLSQIAKARYFGLETLWTAEVKKRLG